jgi:hypothetical protein
MPEERVSAVVDAGSFGAVVSLGADDIRRLAAVGLEPEEQFQDGAGNKNSEKAVPPIHENKEETTMETGTAKHSGRAPATGGEGTDAADRVDQAALRTAEAAEQQVLESRELNTRIKQLLDAQAKATSYKADAYQVGKIALGVAFGGVAAGGLVWWMVKPAEPELTVASMPAKK